MYSFPGRRGTPPLASPATPAAPTSPAAAPASTTPLAVARSLHIAGLGPAGALLALRAAELGWSVRAHDPAATARSLPEWHGTYGVLEPDIPSWARRFFTDPVPLTVVAGGPTTLGIRYCMLDTAALRAAVTSAGIPLTSAPAPRGAVRCTGAPRTDRALWQLAFGRVVSFSDATTHSQPEPIFMDWSGPNSQSPPSFLYVQRTAEGWLYEETILAAHCPASAIGQQRLLDVLRSRLEARLSSPEVRALGPHDVVREEVVSIPMGTRAGALPTHFGAAAGFINPATGYSLGSSLRAIDELLGVLAGGRMSRRRRANAWLAYGLRQVGGELIARADQRTLRDFFACFFALSSERQQAYLLGHDGIAVARSMWGLRRHTGFTHPFLAPLWSSPLSVLSAVARRMMPAIRTPHP